VLLIALVLAAIVTAAPAGLTAPELAAALQKKIDTVKDFTTDFTHAYRGGVLRKQIIERGRLMVKKPGKMRWTYTTPEKKIFVSDGVKIYSYIPQDRQVIVSSVPTGDEATTAVMFLAGKGDVSRDFTASYADKGPLDLARGRPPGAWMLKLVPKRAERDYDTLVLALDPATLQIRALTTTDRQGGESTFTFTNMKENRGLSDKEFAFRIPRGVDVITDGSLSR
jgi:outer membrane lipoprotein carrier protein